MRATAMPRFIEEEFRGFLRCGFLVGAFARFHCSALTPRPRINLLLYYGVLGARSAWRSRLERVDPLVPPPAPDTRATARPRTNWPWAELMQRTSGSTSWRVLAVRPVSS